MDNIDIALLSIDNNLKKKYALIKEKYKNIKFIADTKTAESMYAHIFVMLYIKTCFGLSFDKQEFSYNAFGKPYLKYKKKLYFNISHTKNLVAIVFSRKIKNIGIDIEHLRPYNKAVVDRTYNENEKNVLKESHNSDLIYTSLWTIKEAKFKSNNKYKYY